MQQAIFINGILIFPYDGKDFKIGDYYFNLEQAIRLKNFLTEEINFNQEKIAKEIHCDPENNLK